MQCVLKRMHKISTICLNKKDNVKRTSRSFFSSVCRFKKLRDSSLAYIRFCLCYIKEKSKALTECKKIDFFLFLIQRNGPYDVINFVTWVKLPFFILTIAINAQ